MTFSFDLPAYRIVLIDALSDARHGLIKAYHNQACTMEQLSKKTDIPMGKLKKTMTIGSKIPDLVDIATIAWALNHRVVISIVPMEKTEDDS